MPTIIMGKQAMKVEPVLRKKAYAFLEKLTEDDSLPGLHIEPFKDPVDPRVRTGRVDQGYRAVLFKITTGDATSYLMHGIWKHDVANKIAATVRLTINPINGIAEVREAEAASFEPAPVEDGGEQPTKAATQASATGATPRPIEPGLLTHYGLDVEQLVGLGFDEAFAEQAMTVVDEDGVEALAGRAVAEWQGLALMDLAGGDPLERVRDAYSLDEPVDDSGTEDERLIRGLAHPASRLSFAWIEDNDELRRAVDEAGFADWRIFLHPLQRKYVDRDSSGSGKVTGGAGTGKTVVALHRARRLALEAGDPRVLLTTYTTNLASSLKGQAIQLDPDLPLTDELGAPGLRIAGVDSMVRSVLVQAGAAISTASEEVLGHASTQVLQRTPDQAWDDAIDIAGKDLPENLKSPAFLAAEYSAVVLPRRVTTAAGYFRAPRRGRGVALNRGARAAVWAVIEQYRASSRASGTVDFEEASAIAAAYLDLQAETGNRLYDHVLVDEGQDLVATRWQFLRALVAAGANDLFIAEDSHQRIYGQKITLSHLDIKTQGRSRRLTLNYRTTAQNLSWAMSVLDGSSFSDIEGDAESHDGYRSARSGPVPLELACDSISDELDRAATLLREWLADENVAEAPETVGILVRDKLQRERVTNGLAERGVDVRPVEREAIRPGSPVVMTMHRAKGTEFARVLLFGVREGSLPAGVKKYDFSEADMADALLRERSLLYVAASRARDVLAVSWSGQKSSLLAE